MSNITFESLNWDIKNFELVRESITHDELNENVDE